MTIADLLQAIDLEAVEAILAGVAGVTVAAAIEWLKAQLKLTGILTLLMTAVVSCVATAGYLVVVSGFAWLAFAMYATLVFLCSVFGYETIKKILAAIRS